MPISDTALPAEMTRELDRLRAQGCAGSVPNQAEIDQLCGRWGDAVAVPEGEREVLMLVDAQGQSFDPQRFAPRWLCHLAGLRHRVVHVLLSWRSLGLGEVYGFQVRSWDKLDSPGCVDISVGGHIKGDLSAEAAAYDEMREELGLSRDDLAGPLSYVGGHGQFDEEWAELFVAELRSIDSIRFADGEVVGLYVCPCAEATRLLGQSYIPVTGALKVSLALLPTP